ncbi:PREDICTED: protein disulfide isomerase-like 1-3 [Tarenaya hassleriana]|uniref:protein disulfide isomerase-like 1-3 n=1 Tax=Tarenaya hassleriana TaxID=28532 RepID=UPI00053C7C6F|nr:PREDICTED: protein disulfide isomerase-like 1-3 [Tarenaya hassleriana]
MASTTTSIFLALFLSALLLLTSPSPSLAGEADLDEDVAFLASEEAKDRAHVPYGDDQDQFHYQDFENYEDLEAGDGEGGHDHGGAYEEEPQFPAVDDKDVVVLTKENFTGFVGNNSFVMVEFYAPWCGHCQALAPEYAAAATELKGVAALAKVDATEESELAQKYEVQGFPTVFLFVDGQMEKTYDGERTKDAIVMWVKKKTGPSIQNITTTEEAERVLSAERKVVLGFLNSLVGSESEELAAASRLDDDVSFYQTASPDVAKLFEIVSEAKRPALVILKKEDEKLARFDGNFTKADIAGFVSANKAPLVINFTRESASLIFENPIKNQLILFATANETEKHLSSFREVAKALKGKFVFVYVQMDNEDYGQAVSDFFGVTGSNPKVIVYTGNEDMRKFLLDGELTLENIKTFGEDFLADKLKPFYKSDPIPEKNDDDVKIVVGNNFDEIVLDESKDVLLEIYAPWCGHCQAFEPTYNKLGKYLKGIETIVIAKMDGTTNEHPRAKADGYPTILFFPAGNKSFDPITVETDRTVVEIYKFLKKHASIPFKLQKPASSAKPPAPEPVAGSKGEATVTDDAGKGGGKDEL